MRIIGAVLLAEAVLGCGATTPSPAPQVASPTASTAPTAPPTVAALIAPPAPSRAAVLPSATARPCEPTVANGAMPPGEEPGASVYGEDGLFVSVWPSGEVIADPRFVEPDGSVGMKFWIWRASGRAATR